MGWNKGYTIFEQTVIGAYDLGKLDKALLCVLMEPYRDSDIDSGGSRALRSKDGKDVEQVVCEIFGKTLPSKPNLPSDHKTWTEAQDDENENYWNQRFEAFSEITDQFGWR